MKNKSIIISTYDDITNPHYRGGGAIAIHELAKRLEDNYDVAVLTWNHSGKKQEYLGDVRYERIGFSFFHPKLAMLMFQILMPIYAKFRKYDVWLESFGPPFTTSFLPLFTKKNVVGIVHMLAAEDMKRKYKILPFSQIERIGISKYTNIITTNEFLARKISKINQKASVNVISNGIGKVTFVNRKRNKNILFLGRLEIDQKGIDLLIQSFKLFKDSTDNAYRLVIAGSGTNDQIRKLRSLIKEYDLKKNVKLVGWVAGDEKATLLKKSAVMVIPSRFETYSMVALEAMAYGLPIVCFDIDGLGWISTKAAIKVSKYDIVKFAKALNDILTNNNTVQNYHTFGPNYAKQFTWDNIANQYNAFIKKLIKA